MKKTIVPILVILTFCFALSSCDDFFSSSFGKRREYDQSKMNIDAGNIEEWVEKADKELAGPASEKTLDVLNNMPSGFSKDKAKLVRGGAKLAVKSTGLGETILNNAVDALTELLGEDSEKSEVEVLGEILDKILDDFEKNGGANAADVLSDIINHAVKEDTAGPNEAPKFEEEFIELLTPTEVAEAILLLVLDRIASIGEIYDNNWENLLYEVPYLTFNTSPPEVRVLSDAGPNDVALAAYLNLLLDPEFVKGDENIITKLFKDALLIK